MSRQFFAEAAATLDELYAQLPTIECKGLCHDTCGPILMSEVEKARIVKKTGARPAPLPPDSTCNMLKQGRCRVYEIRPTICRLWGVVDNELMRCKHGCTPDPEYLTYDEGKLFLAKAQELGAVTYEGRQLGARMFQEVINDMRKAGAI